MREHTVAIGPPRALWVPFMLGRPLGAPDDAAFQRRVLIAALALLESQGGPVLEDFPDDAPQTVEETGDDSLACPVAFTPSAGAAENSDVQAEITRLKPWHALAVERRGGTTIGLSGLSPAEAARFVEAVVAHPAQPPYRADLGLGLALRLACEDLKAFYLEAAAAQPGRSTPEQAQLWFWLETAAGKLLIALRSACVRHDDRSVRVFARLNLIPRSIGHLLGIETPSHR